MEHEHSIDAIAERLSDGPRHNYLRDWIYGGIDGSIATFAVVTGVVGARLSPVVLIIMGLTTTFAEGFAMAAANFLGTKVEHDDIRRLEEIEHRHIDENPEGEREEVRQIFALKGFDGSDLERVVDLITSDRARWVQTMLRDEYGLPHAARSPWMAALSTLSAFVMCGLVPLTPFLIGLRNSLAPAVFMTCAVFFLIGSLKSRWSTVSWWRSGLSTFIVGGVAACVAYIFGLAVKDLVR